MVFPVCPRKSKSFKCQLFVRPDGSNFHLWYFFFFCRCVARCSLVGRSRSEPWQKKKTTEPKKTKHSDGIAFPPLQTRLFVSLVRCVPRRSPPSEHLQVWLVDDDNIAGLAPCSRNSGRGLNSYFKAFFISLTCLFALLACQLTHDNISCFSMGRLCPCHCAEASRRILLDFLCLKSSWSSQKRLFFPPKQLLRETFALFCEARASQTYQKLFIQSGEGHSRAP